MEVIPKSKRDSFDTLWNYLPVKCKIGNSWDLVRDFDNLEVIGVDIRQYSSENLRFLRMPSYLTLKTLLRKFECSMSQNKKSLHLQTTLKDPKKVEDKSLNQNNVNFARNIDPINQI